MIWIGLAIVVLTFYLIYKNYEARLVLACSGLIMALLGQVFAGSSTTVSAAVDAFVKQLVNGGLVPTIVTVMGFGYVMSYTKCSDHLVNMLVKPLTHVPFIVIPGAALITWVLNIILPSAAGIAAAVGDSADSCTDRAQSSSCHGGCRRVCRNLGLSGQPGPDVQSADCFYRFQS